MFCSKCKKSIVPKPKVSRAKSQLTESGKAAANFSEYVLNNTNEDNRRDPQVIKALYAKFNSPIVVKVAEPVIVEEVAPVIPIAPVVVAEVAKKNMEALVGSQLKNGTVLYGCEKDIYARVVAQYEIKKQVGDFSFLLKMVSKKYKKEVVATVKIIGDTYGPNQRRLVLESEQLRFYRDSFYDYNKQSEFGEINAIQSPYAREIIKLKENQTSLSYPYLINLLEAIRKQVKKSMGKDVFYL